MKQIFVLSLLCVTSIMQVQASSELETLINMLHENGTVSDDQYGRLMDQIKAGKKQLASEKQPQEIVPKKSNDVLINIDQGGIQAKTRKGDFTAKLGGRVQVDAAWYGEEGNEMGNGTEIRRARLYIQGKMFSDWGYKLQYDFTGTGRSGIKDAFVSYNGFEHVKFKLGNFKDPFMLQQQTSSKYVTFTERSLVDAFSASRHIGVMASTRDKHWTAAVGLFGDKVNTKSNGKDEGWGLAGRATVAPINEKRRVIHFGTAVNYRNVGDEQNVSFKQQPETHISGVNLLNTGLISAVDYILKIGAEFAFVYDGFSAQSEYIYSTAERSGSAAVDFDGWYAEIGYFLTGESRNYNKGKFSGVSPHSVVGRDGFGAWQIATRYSSIDLNDGDISGGEAESVTIGLNWFPTSTLRFSGNYVKVLDLKGGVYHGAEPDLLQVRGQWAF